MSGRVWTSRMLSAFNTITARETRGNYCWNDKLRSPVMKSWKLSRPTPAAAHS